MVNRTVAALIASTFLSLQVLPGPALADNQMGYQLLSAAQATALPRGGGTLGLNVGRGQPINSGGLSFELLRVNTVGQSSAGQQAGFRPGDQIIAVDGHVFPSVAAFAAYVGSHQPGQQISIDYLPAGGGPQQAQRVAVSLGGAGAAPSQQAGQAQSGGLSTGTKIAIGVGAAALFGCYEVGCFSRLKNRLDKARQQPPVGGKPVGVPQQP